MANDIKQRIVLEGEKEYSSALKEAQRNLKVLRSELKAETAELGKNATEQQKNEARLKNLQKQIKEQEKVVKTYESALQEVKDKYGDNEEAVAKWEVKLNDARTALANMKNQLDQTGESVGKVGEGAKKSAVETYALAESFGKIGAAAESMAGTIEGVFSGILGTIKDTIGAVWGDIMDIAAKADNFMDLASFLGSSATEVQKWDSAMRAAGGDISQITSMISKLKYGGKDKSIAEYFGISGENYTNDLEYAEQILRKMADSKDEMVANGTWAKAMGEIFGAKKVQEIDSILSDWDRIQEGLNTFNADNGGVGMTEDQIKTMDELNFKVNTLVEKWGVFKRSFEAGAFGKLALDLTSNAQGALDALIEFMDADTAKEKDAAIEKFKDNITEAFTKIGEAIAAAAEALDEAGAALQGSENGYVRLLGDVLRGLSSAMEWLTKPDSLEQVKKFFMEIFAIWAGANALNAISTMGQFVTNMINLKNVGNLFGNGGGGGGTQTTTGTGGGTGGTPWLRNLLNNAVNGMGVNFLFGEWKRLTGLFTNEKAEISNTTDKEAAQRKALELGLGISEEDAEALQKEMNTGTSGGRSFGEPEIGTSGGRYFGEPEGTGGWSIEEVIAEQLRREAELQKTAEEIADTVQTFVDEGSDPGFSVEDLPADWWENFNNGNGDETSSLKSIPGLMASAVSRGVSGIKVTLDGATVGMLVAPYVSQAIARDVG